MDYMRLLSVEEMATETGLSVARIRQLAQELGVGRKVGKQWVFREDEIDAFKTRSMRRMPYKKRAQAET